MTDTQNQGGDKVNQHMVDNWDVLSAQIREHIKKMGDGKYNIRRNDFDMSDVLPWSWALGDAFKYIWELVRWARSDGILNRNSGKAMANENILKAMHCLQITHTKLNGLPPDEEPDISGAVDE